jgi:hypothetical protein
MIDTDKLKELLADENATTESIYGGLGYNNTAAFYYHLKKDPEAKRLFQDWRAAHRRTGNAGTKTRGQGKAKKSAQRAAPPRNANAKPRISDELLRKIKHEFAHVTLYGQTTEFFDELAKQVAAIK